MPCEATLCGKRLHGVMHVCALVDSRDEQYAILLPYLREGLRCNAHLVTMVGEANLVDHLTRLRRDTVDPEALMAQGRLTISTAERAFPRDGSVTPASALAHAEAHLDRAQASGFPAVRGFAEMDGALSALRRADELLELEARLNLLALKMANPVVCVYDVNRVPGSLLTEILCAHPKAIIGGVLHENPYFQSPQASLRAERRRRHLRVRERRAWALRL